MYEELIKTALVVFQYENNDVPTGMGWPRDVYFERKSNLFLIQDFPKTGAQFEVSNLSLGMGTITVQGKTYRVRVYELGHI